MKKYWKKILLGIIVLIILIPIFIAFMLSFRVIETDTTNEWIGFWGGYLGSILGGIITLYVMYFTVKNNKENLEITLASENQRIIQERKKNFDDEILEQSLSYYVGLSSMLVCFSAQKPQEGIWELMQKVLRIPELLQVKLISKMNCPDYQHCRELLDRIKITDEKFKIVISKINHPDEKEKLDAAISDMKEELNVLRDEIVQYYWENEGEDIF